MEALRQALARVSRRESAALASVVSVAALLIVLKWVSGSKSGAQAKFITNLAEVADKEGAQGRDEYDVIVVGGGTLQALSQYPPVT